VNLDQTKKWIPKNPEEMLLVNPTFGFNRTRKDRDCDIPVLFHFLHSVWWWFSNRAFFNYITMGHTRACTCPSSDSWFSRKMALCQDLVSLTYMSLTYCITAIEYDNKWVTGISKILIVPKLFYHISVIKLFTWKTLDCLETISATIPNSFASRWF
jgi:hypothetical protein